MEIPDAPKLLDGLDLKGKSVTADAMFRQKSIVAKIVERGGDYVLPVKDNRKSPRQTMRSIEVLPAKAAGIEKEWPAVESICRVARVRQGKKNGAWQDPEEEVVYWTASLPAGETAPAALLCANRGHWSI